MLFIIPIGIVGEFEFSFTLFALIDVDFCLGLHEAGYYQSQFLM